MQPISKPARIQLPAQLPKPDKHDNYWFRQPGSGPAILKGRQVKGKEPGLAMPRWFVSTGDDDTGILTTGSGLKYFDSPEDAFKALRQHWEKAK